MPSGDNQTYEWTVGDVRHLDEKLSSIQSEIHEIRGIIGSKAVIVDNSAVDWNWKTIAIVIGSVIATIMLIVQQVNK